MADKFDNTTPGLTSPGHRFDVITPDDDADLPFVPRAIALPAAGALRVTDNEGNIHTIPDGCLAAGILHPMRPRRIYATGTTVVGNIFITD